MEVKGLAGSILPKRLGATSRSPGSPSSFFISATKKTSRVSRLYWKQADGSTVDIRTGKGDWQTVSVAKVRMCFGCGLPVLPSGAR
jgi:hypothetical protein